MVYHTHRSSTADMKTVTNAIMLPTGQYIAENPLAEDELVEA
jgi:hypothetical protein